LGGLSTPTIFFIFAVAIDLCANVCYIDILFLNIKVSIFFFYMKKFFVKNNCYLFVMMVWMLHCVGWCVGWVCGYCV